MKKRIISYTVLTGSLVVGLFVFMLACNNNAKAKPNFITKDAPKPGIVAKIGDDEITEEALMGDERLEFFELKKREYELKMDRINKLIVERLVGAEAKKANMPLEDYITKNVTKGPIKISQSEYNKFVKEKKIPESQINDQIKGRINAYLETQKRQELIQTYVAKITKSKPVEVYFTKPKMEVQVEVGNAAVWGKADAPVTIVEFSDFQCPFCSRAAETVIELKKKYSGKIKIAFKHFPLPMHKDAKPASESALCINEQSTDKFWKFHDIAFKNQEKLSQADVDNYAKQAGADMTKYNECVKAGKFKEAVQKDMDYGEKIGVRSTPAFFINGQLVAGAVPIEQFSEIIDEAIEDAKTKKQ